jgi:hypothetical protein
MGKRTLPDDAKDWVQSKITIDNATGCWLWPWIGTNPPRARLGFHAKTKYGMKGTASRAIFNLYRPNEFDEHLCVLHTDSCPPETAHACVNPSHLYMGSLKQNGIDRTKFGLQLKGEDHPNHVFCEKEILKLRKLYERGMRITDVYKKCSWYVPLDKDRRKHLSGYSKLREILIRRTWKHI